MEKNIVNVIINDYKNAPDGSLLIKRNNKWVAISYDELNKENVNKLKEIDTINNSIRLLAKNITHFKTYAKSHFLVVFNNFKIKVLSGLIDVTDDNLLNLDDKVLNNEISVENAIEMHPYLKSVFEELYINNNNDKLSEV